MTKNLICPLAAMLSTLVLCSGGCGKSTRTVSQPEATATIQSTAQSVPAPNERDAGPSQDEKEVAALNEMADQLVVLSRTKAAASNAKLQVLFSAANREPRRYATAAQLLAQRMVDEAATDTVQFARSYLILADFRDNGARRSLLEDLAKFACEYPRSHRPIEIYKQLSNRLVTDGKGTTAVAMLKHGIQHCESRRDVEPLERQSRMTMQTMSLLGRTRPASLDRRQAKSARKTSKTSPDSKYYKFIGQRVSLTGRTLQGSAVTSQQLRGAWVYAHFWATW